MLRRGSLNFIRNPTHAQKCTLVKSARKQVYILTYAQTLISEHTHTYPHTYTQFVLFVCWELTLELPILVSNVNASQREIKTPFKQAAVPWPSRCLCVREREGWRGRRGMGKVLGVELQILKKLFRTNAFCLQITFPCLTGSVGVGITWWLVLHALLWY